MGFLLKTADLLSRKLRVNSIAQKFDSLLGDNSATEQVAKIKNFLTFADGTEGESIIDKVWNFGSGIVGFAIDKIKGAGGGIASWVWGRLVAAVNFGANFNFAATDSELRETLKANNIALASAWGGAVGASLGSLAAIALGVGVSYVVPVIGPSMGKAVALSTFREDFPELMDEVGSALNTTFDTIWKWTATESYIMIRNMIKGAYKAGTLAIEGFKRLGNYLSQSDYYEIGGEELAKEKKGQRWTIAEAIENGIESIPGNDMVKAFIEEMAEEGWEKFIETGFIFARELDEQFANAERISNVTLGDDVTPVIELDRDSNETINLPTQPSQLARQQVISNITTFRQIRNRDIGFFTGERVEEESRRFNFLRTGKALFRSIRKPPFSSSKIATITLKDLKAGLKWKDFKTALQPYTWGPHYVFVTLNRSRQEMGGWFSSITEGENYLKKLVELIINDSYIAIDSRTEVERNRYVRKSSEQMLVYPAFLTITVKTPVTDREDATHDLAGDSYEKNLNKIPLWTDTEPPINGLNNTEFLT